MAKKAYIGVSGKARKVKKIYIGVSGKARKVKKGYIGVGGKARLFFSSFPTVTKQANTNLSERRGLHSAATIGSYAIFGPGNDYSSAGNYGYVTSVETFNTSLTRGTATALGAEKKIWYGGASNGKYAVFAGGYTYYSKRSTYFDSVHAFNSSLTQTVPSLGLFRACSQMASASFGSYTVFAGGEKAQNDVNVYNTSLTRTNPSEMHYDEYSSLYYMSPAAATVGNYVLIGGGYPYNAGSYSTEITNKVTAYNTSFTRSFPTTLYEKKHELAGVSLGSYALFAGGCSITSSYNTAYRTSVDAYNASLTRISAPALTVGAHELCGCAVNGCAIFSGGLGSGANPVTNVYYYDESLTSQAGTPLSTRRYAHAGTAIGSNILFAGGSSSYSSQAETTVDVYTVS